jgi:hypothetical protein
MVDHSSVSNQHIFQVDRYFIFSDQVAYVPIGLRVLSMLWLLDEVADHFCTNNESLEYLSTLSVRSQPWHYVSGWYHIDAV